MNTNLLSRADAIEAFNKDGWFERVLEDKSYDNFLKAMEDLADEEYLSDIHVQNLFVFPASSKNYWARNILVKESKVILQDKVGIFVKNSIEFELNCLNTKHFLFFFFFRPVVCQ